MRQRTIRSRHARSVVASAATILVAAAGLVGVGSGVEAAVADVARPPADPVPTIVPLEPIRIVDTRDGTGIAHALGPGETASFAVLGVAGIPAGDVGALALNLTAVKPDADTHLTIYPSGQGLPATSTVNVKAGEVLAGFALASPGPDGRLAVRNNSGTVDLVVDVQGWVGLDGLSGFHTLATPQTASGDPWLGRGRAPLGGSVDIDTAGVAGLPPTGVGAVLIQVTGVLAPDDPDAPGGSHFTVYPAGAAKPPTSNLNLPPPTGEPSVLTPDLRSNLALVSPGAGGAITLANNSGSALWFVRVVGWFDPDTAPMVGGHFVGAAPARLADSRVPSGFSPTDPGIVPLLGAGGLPAGDVAGVAINVTVVARGDSRVGVSPDGFDQADIDLLAAAGTVRANFLVVPPGPAGALELRRTGVFGPADADVIVDVVGYFVAGVSLRSLQPMATKGCDPIGLATSATGPSPACLLPFPNDWSTVSDPSSPTGRRVHFTDATAPRSATGVPAVSPVWNRNDGFSPGSMGVVHLPEVDVAASALPPITDPQAALAADSPVVMIDATDGTRVPVWAELDAHATGNARELLISPAIVLVEGHRYVVGLRDLVGPGAAPIAPSAAFRALRDRITSDLPAVEARRGSMEDIFGVLGGGGVVRGDLQLAWDFTVASTEGLTGSMLSMRDQAFAVLNGEAPEFTVTSVENNVNPKIARRIHGEYVVPSYLTGTGAPGSTLNRTPGDDAPLRNGNVTAPFQCNVPYSVLGAGGGTDPVLQERARMAVYGHGLLGSRDEINAGNVGDMGNEHAFVYCATDWAGMSENDLLTVVNVLRNLQLFPQIADRSQQGILNTLFLGRLMRHPEGLVSDVAFQVGGEPFLDTADLFYDGNSQGGILGAATTAVSQEWTRAVLGVPGINYSQLLPRSVDFKPFFPLLASTYPDPALHPLLLQLIQMLWDRAEPTGYVRHLTDDPLPGTPAHQVLLHVAFGDHQVANVTAEIEARAIGARIHWPALAPGRHTDTTPYWGIDHLEGTDPYDGSAIVVWDSGTPAPPLANIPNEGGADPHEFPRRSPAARLQKSMFLQTGGSVVDVCTAAPCLAPPA